VRENLLDKPACRLFRCAYLQKPYLFVPAVGTHLFTIKLAGLKRPTIMTDFSLVSLGITMQNSGYHKKLSHASFKKFVVLYTLIILLFDFMQS
jgi:hypothetical protein